MRAVRRVATVVVAACLLVGDMSKIRQGSLSLSLSAFPSPPTCTHRIRNLQLMDMTNKRSLKEFIHVDGGESHVGLDRKSGRMNALWTGKQSYKLVLRLRGGARPPETALEEKKAKAERTQKVEKELLTCKTAAKVFAVLAAAQQNGTVTLRAGGLATSLHRIAKSTPSPSRRSPHLGVHDLCDIGAED